MQWRDPLGASGQEPGLKASLVPQSFTWGKFSGCIQIYVLYIFVHHISLCITFVLACNILIAGLNTYLSLCCKGLRLV